MATVHDLFEVTNIAANTTYSQANGNLLGIVDNVTSAALNDGEFDEGDVVTIGGVNYTITRIQEPSDSNGRFTLGDGSQRTFGSGSESNLSVAYLTVSNGSSVRHFIIPNDSYGDMNVQSIRTGLINDVAGSDAAIISTTNNNIQIVCFASGTRIRTPLGEVAVEDIRVGDLVLTRDNGPQEVRMLLVRELDFMTAPETFKPVAFEPGSLGPGRPHSRLCVSPQHRMLATDPAGRTVLVPAKALTGRPGVRVLKGKRRVTYIHLVFSQHEIIEANGTLTESFYPGPMALAAVPAECRAEVDLIFGVRLKSSLSRRPLPAASVLRVRDAMTVAHHLEAAC